MDIGIDNVKDVAKHADLLPLSEDGVMGKEFENKLKERKEQSKEFKDMVPEISGKCDFFSFKRKSPFTPNTGDQKHMRYDNNTNNKKIWLEQDRVFYSAALWQ